jgi:RNase H-fold protein (predicted Holliday junction resolvase)
MVSLMKVLTTPSKIASKLDWQKVSGSILSLEIHRDRIGMAVSTHPSYGKETLTLDTLRLPKKGKLDEESINSFFHIVKDHKVCGVVVSWPLQNTGRMGAACGKTIHILEELLNDEVSNNVITTTLPLCLWDGVHPQTDPEDEWGRCASYCRTSNKQEHRATQEQHENIVAAQVWDDFCRVHWPQLYNNTQEFEDLPMENTWMDENWDDSSAYVNRALL